MQTPLQFVQHTWQIVASACNATRCNDEVPSPSTSMIALEDRVLYDASPLAGILVDINESLETLGDANEDLTEYLVEETAFADFSIATNDSFTLGEDSKQLTFDPGRQLLVIDERLDNLDALIEDIYSQHPSATSFDIVRINQDSDGIAKITEALETGNKYDAIHIVAHGSEAKLQLGSVTLSQDNLSEYTSSLSRWTTGMSLGADILIYGCDVAATDEGHQFVDQISILTGADVAASDNLTGHSSLGGDWVFEYTAGLIETDLVFSAEIQTSYFGTFATVTVDNTLDVVNGATTSIANLIASDGGDGISLREAIIAANADGVADTIILGSGTYGLSLAGSGDELGDLNIINDVEIIGQVDGSSIVDARGIDRVFHVGSNSLTLSRLTVTGGSTTSLGGGIYVSGGSLTARDVIIEGNATSLNGGGIGVLGAMFATTLDLDGVTIRSNTSGSSGGGLNINDTFSQVTATVSGSLVYGNVANIGGAISVGGGSHTISNTTITDNTSLSGSGGIYTAAATVDLVHVTIADNTNLGGADSGGGGLTVANGTVSVQNSIIAGNTSGDAIEISGVINSLGNNIIGDDLGDSIGGVGYDLGSDLLNQTGLDLAPLQDNGGRVQTMELNSGSVGIDGANNAASPETDGRGYFRSDGQADIGAFERGAAANLEQDLVGHFQFDYDSVTTAVDSSVTANDGTWKNGVATVGNGPVGEAGDFEDPSRYVTIGSNAAYDFGAQDFSIALWYKAGPQPTSTTLLDKIGPFSGGNGDTAGVLIRATSTGSLSAFVEGQTGAFVFLPTTFDTTETWHHITLTRSGDVFRFYVDGVEVGTQTNAIGSVDNTSGIRLGEDDSVTSDEYVGQLDDVRFYSRALSEGEAAQLMTVAAPNSAPRFTMGDGTATTQLGNDSYGSSVAVQADGKYLVAGTGNLAGDDATITRYNADGTLDTTFGVSGIAIVDFGETSNAQDIEILADGKILIGGRTSTGFALAQLNGDGTPDTNFGSNGQVVTDVGTSEFGREILIQSDGKIVLAGTVGINGIGGDTYFAVLRYNVDGSPDGNFGVGGIVTTDFPGLLESGNSAALTSDGKIVVAGRSYEGTGIEDFAIARYNADGSPDTTFGGDGKLVTDIGGGAEQATAVVVQPDGKIVVAGHDGADFAAIRYNVDGSLDNSFGTGGIFTIPDSGWQKVGSAHLLSNGQILVGGEDNGQAMIVRLNSDGTQDYSFGVNGIFKASGMGQVKDMLVQADGTIVIAGSHEYGDELYEFSAMRVTADGVLDSYFGQATPTFTQGGTPVVLNADVLIYDAELSSFPSDFGGGTLTIERVGGANANDVFGGSGTLTLGATEVFLNGVQKGTYTVSTPGQLEITFDAGATSTEVNQIMPQIAYENVGANPVSSVDILWTFDDGNTGEQGAGGNEIVTAKSTVLVLTDSTENTAPTFFNTADGIAVANYGNNGDEVGETIELASGQLLAVGQSDGQLRIARHNPDGSLDTSFNGTGYLVASVGDISYGYAVDEMADGRLVIAGQMTTSGVNEFLVARFNADGTLDETFNGDGIFTYDSASSLDRLNDVEVLADGTIFAVGTGGTGVGNEEILVMKILATGTLDTGFGGDGIVSRTPDVYSEGVALAVQADGKIVIAGSTHDGSDDWDFVLTRLESNGVVDSSFGSFGTSRVDIAVGRVDNLKAIELLPTGEIVAVGRSTDGSDRQTALIQLDADGDLDTGFGVGGIALDPILTFGEGLAVDGAGNIFVGGTNGFFTASDAAVAKFDSSGNVDGSFGSGGIVEVGVAIGADFGRHMFLKSDGNLVITGAQSASTHLIQMDGNGVLDPTFGADNSLGGAIAYSEGSTVPVALDINVSIFDEQLSTLEDFGGATLTLNRVGGVNTDDNFNRIDGGNLAFVTGNKFELSEVQKGSYQYSLGQLILTFDPGTTNADVNEVMQSIGYRNLVDDAPPASVDIQWTFSDGNTGDQGTGGSLDATGITTVNITAVNDKATVDLDVGDESGATGGDFSTTFIGSPVLIADSDAILIDPDSVTIYRMDVKITNLLDGTDESLSVDVSGYAGLSASYSSTFGSLVISGAGTIADYEAILRTIEYNNAAVIADSTTRIISVEVTDGGGFGPISNSYISFSNSSDGIVQGTAGDDVIDNTYVDPVDGEMVDNADGTGPGGNEDVIHAGAGNDNIVSGDEADTILGGSGDDVISTGGATYGLPNFVDMTGAAGTVTGTNGNSDSNFIVSSDGTLNTSGPNYYITSDTQPNENHVHSFSQPVTGGRLIVSDLGTPTYGSGFDLLVDGVGIGSLVESGDASIVFHGNGYFVNSIRIWGIGPGDNGATITIHKSFSTLSMAGGHQSSEAGRDTNYTVAINRNPAPTGDTVDGGDGADTILIADDFAHDAYAGGEGGSDLDSIDASANTTRLNVKFTGDEAGTISDGSNSAIFSEIEDFILTSGDDSFDASAVSTSVIVDAGAGADTIIGGGGDDDLTGGASNDTYVLSDGFGNDTIRDFVVGQDMLDVSALNDAGASPVDTDDVVVSEDGSGNAVLTFPNGETLILIGHAPSEFDSVAELAAIGIPPGFNDLPITDLNGSNDSGINFSTSFTEGDAAILVADADATISDPDNTTYDQLGINLGGFLDGNNETIRINGVVFNYDEALVTTTTVGGTTFEIDFDGSGFMIAENGGGVIPQVDLQALLRTISYQNPGDVPSSGDRTLTFIAIDSDGGVASPVAVSTITVVTVNNAPEIDNNAALQLTTITEDDIGNAGNTVAEILASDNAVPDPITDADGDPEGIAITSLSGGGTWQFDTGAGWTDIGTVSFTNALLLRDSDSIRYVPDGLNGELGGVVFQAWDQSTGGFGTKADTSNFGGTTAYSTHSDVALIMVTDVNDAPMLNNSGLNFLPSINEDAINTAGETVANFIASVGGDSITDVDPGSVEGIGIYNTDASNGTWEYSPDGGTNWIGFGTPSPTATLLLSADAMIRFEPDADFSGTPTFAFVAWDQTAGVEGGTLQLAGNTGANGTFSLAFDTGLIDVNPVNDVPTISNLDASVLEFTAGGAPVALTDGASLADIDSAIQTLIVRITNPVDGANEQLGFVHASTIGSNYDVSTGTLTLTNLGSAINGDFQVALESVSYENFSPTLNTTTRNITFVANDGLADSLEANVSVLMNGDVVAPTLLNNLTGSVDEGGAFNIAPEYLEFLDLQGAAEVTYTVTAVPVNGYLALKSNRAVPIVGFTQANIDANDVIYVHDGSETAADSFEFTVDDGQGNFTSTQQFSLDVNPINDEPVLTLTGMTVDEGSLNNAITSAMLSGFDVDDAPAGLTFRVISDVSDGSIVLNDGSGAIVLSVSDTFTQADIGNGYLSYSHDGSENATVLFDVELYDGGEDGVGSQFGTFTISINPINDAPDGVHVISQGNEGTAIGITLRGVDDDGTIASYNLGSLPANGTLYSDLQNGTVAVTGFDYPSNGNLIFHFVPDADFNGLTSFSFTVTDDLGLADDTPSTATIEVLAVNDAPVLNALITQDGVEDTPFTFSVANGNPIQVTDVDALGGSLKVDLNVNDGTLVLATTNGLTVVTGNGTGVVSFVGDINEINAALDGLIFQPNENFNGPVTVNVSVDDLGNTGSGGALVSNQVFNIDVASVNDAPTDIAPNAVTVPEDLDTSSGLIVATLSATDVDVGDTFSYAIMPGDDSARFSIVNDQIILSDGVLDYETKSSYVVTVEVTDSGGLSHQESLTINVEDSNEAPVATANIGSVDEGTVHLITNSMLQATDLEQTPSELNYSVLVSPTNGTLLRSGVVVDVGDTFTQADIDNNLLVYVHDGSESLSDGFQFSVDDGEGLSTGVQTANISINPINDAPVASDDAFVVDEDTVLVGSAVTANDSDAESNLLTVGLVSGPEHADSFTFNPDASFSYVPESNYFGTDSFVYLIDDGNGGTDTAIVTIQVSPVNDVPIAETDTFQLISGALNTIVLDVLANDIDIDGDALVAVLAVGPTNGTLTIDSDGQFVYTADPGFTGVDSFTYFASDSSGISVARGVQIAVIIPAVPVIPETTNPDLSPDSPSEFEEQTTLEEESETEEDQSELEEDHEKENLEGQLNALTSNIAPIADVAEDEGFKSEAQIKELLEIMTSQGEARVALQSILASTSVGQGEDLRKFEELDKLARSSNMKTVYDASFLWGQIDDQLKSTATFKPFSITVGAISAVGTVGYILWTLRGGALMALALTQLPSWRMIDPLPILDSYSKGGVNKVEDELGKFF